VTVAADSAQMALAAILGESQVVSEPAACAAWAVGGKVPKYGVEPPTAECVAAVLKIAADHDLAVIPRGNGTQLDLGSPPSRYDLSVSLRKLNRVRHFEPADLTIGVEAGMKLGELGFPGPRRALASARSPRRRHCDHRRHSGYEFHGTIAAPVWLRARHVVGHQGCHHGRETDQERRARGEECGGLRPFEAVRRIVRNAGADCGSQF